MLSCQNPQCQNPFNPDTNKYCQTCGSQQLSELFRHRYRVIKVLGEGGFGKTYLTEDADRLDSPCVIKQFAPQVTGTAALRKATELFKHEARQLYELGEHHSQIPRLDAYFEYGTSLYLVQEFIQGDNLLTELKQKPYKEQQIRELLTDLLPVLDFIHTRNVIHRDIKPDNIIRRQQDRKLVLIDFGGAKRITQTNLAIQGTGLYTPGYAPTEQMSGRAIPASDLYALGVTCVRLLTQCLPIFNLYGEIDDDIYDALSLEWLWRQHLQTMGVTISNELAAILDKLLIHAPKERYQTAQEVLRDLNSPPPQQRIPTAILVTPPSQSTGTLLGGGVPLKTFNFDVVTVDSQSNIKNRQHRQAEYFPEDLGNSVTLEMVPIPGGTFLMGSPDNEQERSNDESQQHKVKISPFVIGKTPVTQAQWQAVAALPQVNQKLDAAPSHFKGANRPVEQVTWYDAIEFCARLSKKTGRKYRLPSEAEWEYACRAGTTTPFHFGETISPEIANYDGNYTYGSGKKGKYRQRTTVVGSFQVANAFGLYDMHGNVWEWCADFWHENYDDAPNDGSVWEFGGDDLYRMLRGGSWSFYPSVCRSANRYRGRLNLRNDNLGFRIAC